MHKIKVLIVDDSALTRKILQKIISADSELEVVDTAIDPIIAMRKIEKYNPDVITLDLELPRVDGLTFLKQLMAQRPLPVIIISGLSEKGSQQALRAMEYGAVDVIAKPEISTPEKLQSVSMNIQVAIKAAYQAKPKLRTVSEKDSLPIALSTIAKTYVKKTSNKIMAIGASTGGTEAIREVLMSLSPDCPGVVVVQHMPEIFTRSFAERLNSQCEIVVKEAENNDEVTDGCAFIAPGNKHMTVINRNGKHFIQLNENEKVNRHRPSVDVLFRSVAAAARNNAYGILLTGMGDDGAAGLLAIKENGGMTVAQDKDTSVVFGMPRRAIELGAARTVLPLHEIATFVSNKILTI